VPSDVLVDNYQKDSAALITKIHAALITARNKDPRLLHDYGAGR
jgi:hypothetical protein